MTFIFRFVSLILAVVLMIVGVPVNEEWVSNLKEELFPMVDTVYEDTVTNIDDNSVQSMSLLTENQIDEYHSAFDVGNITTDELDISIADMYSGKTTSDSLASTNYSYLINEFTSPYRTVYDTLISSTWYDDNKSLYDSVSWTPSEMQADQSYYYLLVYSDLLRNGISSYCLSNSYINETLAVALDMGKQMADTLYVDYYSLIDVAAADIPDEIYISLAETYELDSSAVLSIKKSTNLGSSVFEFLRKLSVYVVIDDYFASLSSTVTQVRSQTKDTVIQNALNTIVNSLMGASEPALEYINTDVEVIETVAFDVAVEAFIDSAISSISEWSAASGKTFDDLVTEYLYSSTENIGKFKTLGVICDFESLVRTVASKNNSAFLSNATIENADKVIATEMLTVYTVIYGLNALSSFSSVVVSENLQETLGFSEAAFTNYVASLGEVKTLINDTEAYTLESAILFWVDLYWTNYYDLFLPLGDYEQTDYTTIVINNNGDLTFENNIIGDGSVSNPYRIYSADDFKYMRDYPNQHYILMNDIIITSTNNWTPIPIFNGSFNGNGYAVNSLIISSNSSQNAGLIAINNGRIRNLTISDASVTAKSNYTGILVGTNNGYIINCSSSGQVTINSSGSVGGLVGYNTSVIENCSSSATVTASTTNSSVNAGGLVGYNYAYKTTSRIEYSYATGSVSGYRAGGFVGYNYANYYNDSNPSRALINCCYAKGNVYGTYAGGFVGSNKVSKTGVSFNIASITYCYAVGDVGENNAGCGFAGENNWIIRFCYYSDKNIGNSIAFKATLTKLATKDTYYGWDFDNIWSISETENDGYPYLNVTGVTTSLNISGWGVANSPYIITNEKQLIALADGTLSKSAHYRLGNDIAVTANHWTPIAGNYTGTFSGVFNGDNYTISGVQLSDTYFSTVGFIADNSGTICNLYIKSTFTGIDGRTGGLVGYNSGTVKNCHAESTISNATNATNYSDIGGLVGYNIGTITESSSSGSVTHNSRGSSSSRGAGGLVGVNYNGTISLSYSSSDVTSSATYSDFGTGGFVGNNCAHSSTASVEEVAMIEYCYSTGTVNGYCAGGFAGKNYSYGENSLARISNSYAQGDVTGSTVGGFVCNNIINNASKINNSEILYCYASGNSGENNIGAGLAYQNNCTIRYSYYNASNIGNTYGFSANATRMRQQATYYGWDFNNVWDIIEGTGLPTLNVSGNKAEISIVGEGTIDNPYLIENELQLFALVDNVLPLDGCYKLLNDITVTAMHWTPIGSNGTPVFSGVFDGSNYKISGIKLPSTTLGYIGLFGYNTGTVKNLKVEAQFADVNSNYVGGLVAFNDGITDNCSVDANISNIQSDYAETGGFAGHNNGIIKNSSSSGSVSSKSNSYKYYNDAYVNSPAGGFVGMNRNATISECSSSAEVIALESSTSNYSGGLVGTNLAHGSSAVSAVIEYSYASGNVTGYNAGGLVGYNFSFSRTSNQTIADGIVAKINNCYALGNVTGTKAAGLVCSNNTDIGSSSYKYGYATITYCYATGLANEGSGAGLVYSGLSDSYHRTIRYCYYNSGNVGNQLGFSATPEELKTQDLYFGWNFNNQWAISETQNDGYPVIKLRGIEQKIEISGFGDEEEPYIIENEQQLWALTSGQIEAAFASYYLLANDIYVSAKHWTPIGGNGMADFTGVFDGNGHSIYGITLENTGYEHVGLFGKNSGIIKNLGVSVKLEGGTNTGALAGTNNAGGVIEKCYSTGTVSSNSIAGGLVGWNYANTSTNNILNCYSTANVSSKSYAGGLVGCNQTYSTSSGYANIANSYAIGNVVSERGTSYVGGVLGQASGRSSINNSFYNSETTGCTDTAKGTPCTTEQMKLRGTYSGFDFDTVWAIDSAVNDGYPFLRIPGYSTEAKLLSISIVQRPEKTTYYVGDILDPTGLLIRLNYSNGTSETISTGFTTTYDFDEAGTKTVRVIYETKSVTFSCTILPIIVENIEIIQLPNKLNYFIDDAIDVTGMVVVAYFNNGTEKEIADYTLDYDFSSAGENVVTVNYQDVSAKFNVVVSEVRLERIEITSLPEKTVYYIGEELDKNGLVVTAYYDNGTSRTVSNYEVSYDFSVTGSAIPVTVSFNDKTAIFTVEVKTVLLESIAITQLPIKTSYIVGETFDISGMEVTAYYDNNTSKIISDYSLSYDFSMTGDKIVTVSYMSKTATVAGTVEPIPPVLEELMITQLPAKLKYYQNEVLDLSGMVVTAIYSDGSSADVTDYTIEGYRPQLLGTQTVVVKYNELSTTFEVSVIEPVAFLNEKLIVSSETAKAGENVTVKVNVENNPGLAAFRFYMDYDTSLLNVVSINQGSALADGSLRHNLTIADGKLIVIWDYPENSLADGELFEITFTVSENAPVGEIPLTIYYDAEDVCNEDLENVEFSVIEGGITVFDTVYGDINSDGSINMKDKLLLSKYLANSISFTDSQLAAADVYKDGAINMRDALLFNQYLTGYEVTLGQEV